MGGRHLSHPQEEQPPVQGGDRSWLGLGAMLGRETKIPRTLSSDEISTNQFATLDPINVLSPPCRNQMFTNTFCASGGRRLTDHCDTQPIFSESGLLGARTGAQSGGNTH